MQESLEELQMAKDKLNQDFERLKNEETEKEKRLKEFSAITDKHEQAKQDLKGEVTFCIPTIYDLFFLMLRFGRDG